MKTKGNRIDPLRGRLAERLDRAIDALGATVDPDAIIIRQRENPIGWATDGAAIGQLVRVQVSRGRSLTFRDGLEMVKAGASELLTATMDEIGVMADMLIAEKRVRQAVLARAIVPEWSAWRSASVAGAVLWHMLGHAPKVPDGEEKLDGWPADATATDVLRWLQQNAASSLVPGYLEARHLYAEMHGRLATVEFAVGDRRRSIPDGAVAALYLAHLECEEGRRRKFIAIDAGRTNHDLLSSWRDVPKDTRQGHPVQSTDGRIELLAPGRSVQLHLDIEGGASSAIVREIKNWRGWMGLRNWAALQRLLSVEGGRSGVVRWSLDAHLEALGYSNKKRLRHETRAAVAREVEMFTKLELAVRGPDGKERERRPLIFPTRKFDKLVGSDWVLDGMELQINPLLYGGVRAKGGEIGRNWHPAPVEIAQVDHVRHP